MNRILNSFYHPQLSQNCLIREIPKYSLKQLSRSLDNGRECFLIKIIKRCFNDCFSVKSWLLSAFEESVNFIGGQMPIPISGSDK